MVRAKRAGRRVWIWVVLVASIVLLFYPKERVTGGLRGGPIGPGASAYREDRACIGVPHNFCPNWPDYGCDRLCFGLTVGRVCSIETYDPESGVARAPTVCEGPTRVRWWVPPR